MKLHPAVRAVTERIRERSAPARGAYLQRVERAAARDRGADRMGCANVAHAFAALPANDKLRVVAERAPNIGIVNAYNDMLSAHAPYARYPDLIKEEARRLGATAQVAGGVPAMCDGVTQGTAGMELSLFSRDVIALSTAIALSHNVFDAVLCLGVCDKIVPGLLIGALHFGHLPTVFVPGGPMPSGLSNNEKSKVRERAAQGLVGRDVLLDAESRAYHSPGTCTFYGTANSNQMLMEAMGLHVPGSAFVNPGNELRDELTRESVRTVLAGVKTKRFVPLLARVYPNGSADVNQFQAAGGPGYVIRELLDAGLMHEDALTVREGGLREYTRIPGHDGARLQWREAGASGDDTILRPASAPFSATGGLRLLTGNLGRSVIKVSAVPDDRHVIEAPARIFDSQEALLAAFNAGEMERDVVCVVRWQGPRANGMPELHKLTPPLAVLQGKGFRVALVTDGRMSGASGKAPAAIHVSPEAAAGGPLALLRDGDVVRVDAVAGTLSALVPEDEWSRREPARLAPGQAAANGVDVGRELFAGMRRNALAAEEGACTWL
jgi:phosphogluconate dehydratase